MRSVPLKVAGWVVLMFLLRHAVSELRGTAAAPIPGVSARTQPPGSETTQAYSGAIPWCPSAGSPVVWQQMQGSQQTVLGKTDVHACSVLPLPATEADHLAYTQTLLDVSSRPGVHLYHVLLLECDKSSWQLSGIQDLEHVCLANTAALRASCNQWLLEPPAEGQNTARSCAPPGTAFGNSAQFQNRVLVLQAHWRMSAQLTGTAVQLPTLTLKLGAVPAIEAAGPASAASAPGQPGQPALFGSFVGSGVYQPSSLSDSFPALSVPGGVPKASASFMCGKRCTFKPLGRMTPKPVNVVGYSFTTFDRAVSVALEIKRGWAGKQLGPVMLQQAMGKTAKGVVALDRPIQLLPGDVLKWRCTYDTSDIPSSSSIKGGFSANSDSLQEQCTVVLHYWPRVDSLRGCLSATVDDVLRGENMCSNEVEDLLEVRQIEAQQFPMRRMYSEHSFPKATWMGGWKATRIVLQMLLVLITLWGSQTLLAKCKALGSWHRRFLQLDPGQQRNVSVYITHLILDTVCLLVVCKPMVELWLGMTETAAEVLPGEYGFTYLVACYILELTWRRSVDGMLAVHHIGTVVVIVIFAGELTPDTYRVANNLIVIAAFAVLEQPTYVALLLKRMLPASSPHVHRSAYVGYTSWFAFKILSILIASRMFVEDWHLMPNWLRINFVVTWVVAIIVQMWSGVIQYGIYRQAKRNHEAALAWRDQQGNFKASLLRFSGDGSSSDGDACDPSPLGTPTGSDGSEDCIAAVNSDEILGAFAKAQQGPSTLTAAAVQRLPSSTRIDLQLSPSSSGSLGATTAGLLNTNSKHHRSSSRGSRGSGKQVRLTMPAHQGSGDAGGSGSGDDEGAAAGCSSGARVHRTGKGTLQRRSKSGLLNLMECGLGMLAGQED